MSSEQTNGPLIGEQQAESIIPELGQGVIIPIQREARHRQMKEERAFVHGFTDFAKENIGINPFTMAPEDSPQVAKAAQSYLASKLQRKIDEIYPPLPNGKHHRVADTPDGPIISITPGPVTRYIEAYYKEHGTDRRKKSPVSQNIENIFLKRAQKPLRAEHHEKRYDPETGSASIVKRDRDSIFPETADAKRLHALLQAHGHTLAADSVEVVLAAYGAHFTTMFGERGIIVERDDGTRDVVLEPNAKKHVPMGRIAVQKEFEDLKGPGLTDDKPRNFKKPRTRE